MQALEKKFIKSPLNYVGGKYKILNQIIPFFPKNIHHFVDLFAGGGNVSVNVNAKKITLNDNLFYTIDMYKVFQDMSKHSILEYINKQISRFNLSKENEEAYKNFRFHYNKRKKPLDLFILIAYSFNHQIRFNSKHEFNNPFGRNRSSYNKKMEQNLIDFITALKNKKIECVSTSFEKFDVEHLNDKDFVYCDPPYLITTGTYNDGKRGFKGWGAKEELNLLNYLDNLNFKKIRFALSNVIEHKGKSNEVLKNWLKQNHQYKVNVINNTYCNCNYQTIDKSKNSSNEVLITNYNAPINELNDLPLFYKIKDKKI